MNNSTFTVMLIAFTSGFSLVFFDFMDTVNPVMTEINYKLPEYPETRVFEANVSRLHSFNITKENCVKENFQQINHYIYLKNENGKIVSCKEFPDDY